MDSSHWIKWLDDSERQACHVMLLGTKVCPRIIEVGTGYYVMEKCLPVDPGTGRTLQFWMSKIRELLSLHVWVHPLRHYNPSPWATALEEWSFKHAPWLNVAKTHALLYEQQEPASFRLIHGDPTLANLMQRMTGGYVLIDPIAPRGKVPPLIEVDRGKMLQSVMGWEAQLDKAWEFDAENRHVAQLEVTRGLSDLELSRAWFWAAVHCARILPYAKVPKVRDWASNASVEATLIMEDIMEGLRA